MAGKAGTQPRIRKITTLSNGLTTGQDKTQARLGHKPMDYNGSAANSTSISLRQKAQDALVKLLENNSTPPAVKAASARTLLELVGAIGAKRIDQIDPNSDMEQLSIAEIDRRLKDLDDTI